MTYEGEDVLVLFLFLERLVGVEFAEVPDEEAATEGSISTEGIALVRLCRLYGVSTWSDYPMIPSLALRTHWQPGATDVWMAADQ